MIRLAWRAADADLAAGLGTASASRDVRRRLTKAPWQAESVAERVIGRVLARIVPGDAGECWLWPGHRDRKGYGVVATTLGSRSAKRSLRVPRVVLAAKLGRILDEDELACHSCDNPPCCNPAHLFAGSRSDNAHDMLAKGRQPSHMSPRPTCPRGHPMADLNLRVDDHGGRHCRECGRANARERRARLTRQADIAPAEYPLGRSRSALAIAAP